MVLPAKKFNEIVAQMLFAFELGSSDSELALLFMDEVGIPRKKAFEAYEKALSIWEIRETLDEKIRLASQSFEFERIGRVEKSILRHALSALLIESKPLVIAEAIRLTCKFSTKEASLFVHAILDAASKDAPLSS